MATETADDWTLLGRASREPAALATLFERHRDTVFRFAYGRLRDEDAANEATQEVFLRLAKLGRPMLRRAKFTTWLYQVTRNVAVDEIRRRARESGEPLLAEPRVEESATANAELNVVLRILETLPDRQREVFALRMLEGWSVGDTARAMGVSEGSVKTHLHRALNAVRQKLEAS